MVKTTVYIDEQDKKALKSRSTQLGVSEAELIRTALRENLYGSEGVLPAFANFGSSSPECSKLDKHEVRKMWAKDLIERKSNL